MKLLSSVLALAVSISTAHAGTLTVAPAPGPGVDFTSIQAAVDAAVDGDLILIRKGGYLEQVRVDGKSLTLQGEQAANVGLPIQATNADPVLLVENLSPGQSVHVRNLSVTRITGIFGDSILLRSNAGSVWLEHVSVDSYDGPAMRAVDCDELVLADLFLQANSPIAGPGGTSIASPSLELTRSQALVFDTRCSGARGGKPLFVDATSPADGGSAIVARNSQLTMMGMELIGGSGGSLQVGGCALGSVGGSAVQIDDAGGLASSVLLQGTAILSAGSTGNFDAGCALDPGTAATFADPSQVVTYEPGPVWSLSNPGVLNFSSSVEFEIQGAPGASYLLFWSPDVVAATGLAGINGQLLIDPAGAMFVEGGTLNVLGEGGFGTNLGTLGFPLAARCQALFLEAGGSAHLSGLSTLFLE